MNPVFSEIQLSYTMLQMIANTVLHLTSQCPILKATFLKNTHQHFTAFCAYHDSENSTLFTL